MALPSSYIYDPCYRVHMRKKRRGFSGERIIEESSTNESSSSSSGWDSRARSDRRGTTVEDIRENDGKQMIRGSRIHPDPPIAHRLSPRQYSRRRRPDLCDQTPVSSPVGRPVWRTTSRDRQGHTQHTRRANENEKKGSDFTINGMRLCLAKKAKSNVG